MCLRIKKYVEIEVPSDITDEFEIVGYGRPKKGDWYLGEDTEQPIKSISNHDVSKILLKKKVEWVDAASVLKCNSIPSWDGGNARHFDTKKEYNILCITKHGECIVQDGGQGDILAFPLSCIEIKKENK